jgi:hypothetical protein
MGTLDAYRKDRRQGIDGHWYKDRRGDNNPSWRGGRQKSGNGRYMCVAHGHPRADDRGRVLEYVLVAERASGKLLPKGVVVHHVNSDPSDSSPRNLVICEDQGYHLLLHRRQRALRACGHADWFRCRYCRQWGPKDSMYVNLRPTQGPLTYHRACHAVAAAVVRERKRTRRQHL